MKSDKRLNLSLIHIFSLLVVVCSLYSLTYMREYEGKGAAAMGFFMNLFIASMVVLLVMDNAFWFIVLFEMMSLSSWFLVIARQDKTSINAGTVSYTHLDVYKRQDCGWATWWYAFRR